MQTQPVDGRYGGLLHLSQAAEAAPPAVLVAAHAEGVALALPPRLALLVLLVLLLLGRSAAERGG